MAAIVVCILVLLWKLFIFGTGYLDIFKHQIQKLYEGLMFFRTILKEHQDEFDWEEAIVGVVVMCVSLIIVFHSLKKNEKSISGEIITVKVSFLYLAKKFRLIKEEEEDTRKYPVMSASDFPPIYVIEFIDSVLEKIRSVSPFEADSVIWSVDKFQTLHDDLVFLRSFLVDVMEQHGEDEKFQALLDRVAEVAYETEFIIDSLVGGDVVQSFIVLLNTIIDEIKLLQLEASGTFHRQKQFTTFQNTGKTYKKMVSVGEISTSDEFTVGLDDDARKIVDQLERGSLRLDIVSIVGMLGLGKTTLAKKIYKDPTVILHFHVRVWCCVSQVHSKRRLLREILSGTDNKFADEGSEMTEDELAHKLYQQLKGKRYLIILDDVWDNEAWVSLRNSFPDDVIGSRILLTSRYHNVALGIKLDHEPYHLRPLTNNESWELLQKKMSFQKACPPELVECGKAIALHCQGLPLMILVVAGLLSNMDVDTWAEVEESLKKGTLPITDRWKETLELSYSHLPDYLKPCFLYFRVFEEDRQIPVRELLCLWIAEGLVKKTERKCLEDVARLYMMELIQRNLVMVGKRGSRGKVKSCILHDLLLDFCRTKGNEKHFPYCLNGYVLSTSSKPVILSQMRVHARRKKYVAISRLLSRRVCGLFIIPNQRGRYERYTYRPLLYKFWPSKLLRTLDLRGIYTFHLFPREIELLVKLRFLALAIDMIIVSVEPIIPSSVDNLSNLETLILDTSLRIVALPDTVWNMKNLRHLSVKGKLAFWKLQVENPDFHSNLEALQTHITGIFAFWKLPKENPESCSCLEHLQTLSAVEFSCGQTMMEGLRKFSNIRRLKCSLIMPRGCTEECRNIELDFMSQLESLTIFQRYQEFHNLHFLFPPNLKKLVLSNFCLPWSQISVIGELPNLEVLKLLHNAYTGEHWDMEEGTFLRLRFLKLAGLDLAIWTASDDNFPSLQTLVLEGCQRLKEVPSCLADVSTLEMIQVTGCKCAVGSIKSIQEALMDMGNDDVKIFIQSSPWDKYPTL